MAAAAYYNENDKYAAAWLRNLVANGLICAGDVDERSIVDVRPADLAGYTQCHFFAGIGGWSYAARLAGWPDSRPLWTGSPPCQPFSVAGQGRGAADERHLWPHLFRLVGACRPAVLMGEQVAAAVGKDWLDGVFADLESVGYACRAVVVPACAVNAPHRRDRLWFVADAGGAEWRESSGWREDDEHRSDTGWQETTSRFAVGGAIAVADAGGAGLEIGEREPGVSRGVGGESEGQDAADDDRAVGDADFCRSCQRPHDQAAGHRHPIAADDRASPWAGAGQLRGADGKSRRVEPGIRLLAHGVPARVGKLRAYGNAIVAPLAAEVIAAFMETATLSTRGER